MGERCGYQLMAIDLRSKRMVSSDIYRKQWIMPISTVTKKMVENLLKPKFDNPLLEAIAMGMAKNSSKLYFTPGSGLVSLRPQDFDYSRAVLSFYNALYTNPFDSLNRTVNCDIEDHGLFILKIEKWNEWKWLHCYVINGKKEEKTLRELAIVKIKEGVEYPNCLEIIWKGTDEEKSKYYEEQDERQNFIYKISIIKK